MLNIENCTFSTHLTDGATMTPISTNLATTMGWDGGISYTCFKKKVLSSETCQNITNWHNATNRICVQVGSSHLTDVQLPGVNCNIALFNFPVVLSMSRILTHLCSRNKINTGFNIGLKCLLRKRKNSNEIKIKNFYTRIEIKFYSTIYF